MSQPLVWALTGPRAGDNAQVMALAAATGAQVRRLDLAFGPLSQMPNHLLGATLATLAKACDADAIRPPWPDLVIASGRRSVPVARFIARASGGRAALAQIGRPRAPLATFALVVTTAQYGLGVAPNVVTLTLPFTPAPGDPGAPAPDLPGPRVAVLLGGASWAARPDAAALDRLARAVARARGGAGSALLLASPRSAPGAVERVAAALAPPLRVRRWGDPGPNPYRAWLAAADAVVVSGDSATMLADAAWTGRPVTVVPMPEPPAMALARRFGGGLIRAWSERGGNLGLAAPPPNLGLLHHRLIAAGWARPGPEGALILGDVRDRLAAERADVLARIGALLASAGAGAGRGGSIGL